MAKKKHEIEVLRTGTFVDANGRRVSISISDLNELADSYDSKIHESPLVAGHPKDNDPALGWAKSFKVVGNKLIGITREVHKNLSKAIKKGLYKKVSLSFYDANSTSNPVPGKKYIRHIGILGAAAPAVPGLKPLAFSDDEKGVTTIDLSYTERATISFMGRLRDFFIEKFGLDEANKVIPQWEIDSARDSQAREDAKETKNEAVSAFSETTKTDEEIDMSEPTANEIALQQKLDAAEAEKKQLMTELSEQNKQANLNEINSFCEKAVQDKKLAPALKDTVVDLMSELSDNEIDFSDGDKSTLLSKFQDFISKQSEFMSFREKSKPEGIPTSPVKFSAPSGEKVNQKDLDKLAKAKAYAKDNNVSLSEAAQAIGE